MIRLRKAGWVFIGTSFLLYLASLTSQSSLLLLLVGIFGSCILANWTVAHRALRGLELKSARAIQISEGQRLAGPWTLLNRNKTRAAFIEIHSPDGRWFQLKELTGGSEARFIPELVYHHRGVYPLSELRVRSSYPFGLVQAERSLELEGELVVYPALYEIDPPRAAAFEAMMGGKYKGLRRSSSGSHFAGVRPLQPGDSLKQIHWKSSAKGLGVMVKTFEEELSGRVALVMDCGHWGEPERLDDCLRAAGSLMFAALKAGHHVEWIDLASLEPVVVPPFDDGEEILDRLARMELAPGCLTHHHLRTAFERVSKRSALSLILTGINEAVTRMTSELRRQGRVVSVYLPAAGTASETSSETTVIRYLPRGLRSPG